MIFHYVYMKKHITKLFILIACTILNASTINVASFNVLGTYPQNAEFTNERTELAADLVQFHEFDVFGTQETRFWQIEGFLKSGVYAVEGVNVEGETPTISNHWTNAIFYRKDRFEVIEKGHFWLANNPNEKSKDWHGEKQFRNCNWIKLRDKKLNKEFYFFNTHFGLNPKVREESAKLFVKKIKEIAKDAPFVTTGDYNTRQTEKKTLKELLGSKFLFDSWKISKRKPYGPKGTFICMHYNRPINGSRLVEDPSIKLDYIFVSTHVEVKKCGVITDNIGGAYPSDHLPIIAVIKIK